MTEERCQEMRLLVQADVDGELTPAEAARVAAHLESCPGCAAVVVDLSSLAARIRADAPRYTAPESLRTAVRSGIVAELTPFGSAARPRPAGWRFPKLGLRTGASFSTGFALAACLALAVILPRDGGGMADAVIMDHIRALQPGHLMDVVSTDQHTVKPWFDGRLAFAPPVKDFRAEGFPLAGGRLDYLDGREVAALIYHSRQHVIELFVWPSGSDLDHRPTEGSRSGYNFIRWTRDGMTLWAVSDLNAGELGDFVRLWQSR
jgi:anti-sigma factor RsiW